MEKRISATRAVREFSELLNTIKFRGVNYIIERGGKPIASMKSIDETIHPVTLGELKPLLNKLPRLAEDWMPSHQISKRSRKVNRLCQ